MANQPEYGGRPEPPVESLARLAGNLLDELEVDLDVPSELERFRVEHLSHSDLVLDTLRRAVGGDIGLQHLDSAALPDEAFVWSVVPRDIRGRVGEALQRCDRCCERLLGTESRTATRRLLARVAELAPDIFRRGRPPVEVAAALCWIIGEANNLFATGGLTVDELRRHFDLHPATPASGGRELLASIGVSPHQREGLDLGMPDLLVSTRRREIVERRDAHQAAG